MNGCGSSIGRRELLAGLGTAAAAGSAGCITDLWASSARDAPQQISLNVKTLPTDADTPSIIIARQFAERLQEVGINATIEPKSEVELLRDVLLNREFDIFVTRHPGIENPDELYSTLHSLFVEEQGWQNPFGLTNVTLDKQLQRQRTSSGRTRDASIKNALRTTVSVQPFSVLTCPEHLTAVDIELATTWNVTSLKTMLDYLRIRPKETASNDLDTLRVALLNSEVTKNRNPIAVEYHDRNNVLGLIYDQIGRRIDGDVEPWLAHSWMWLDNRDTPTAIVRLREDLTWHDGEALTADDVAFTFEFLSDTSMGGSNGTVPAPKFRSQSSLVANAEALSDTRCRIEFEPSSREVAATAFTVPVLPRHVWSEETELIQEYLTQAMVDENRQPVGSGMFAFDSATAGEQLTLQSFDDHFLSQEREQDLEPPVEQFAGGPAYDTLEYIVTPSGAAAIELIENDEMDIVGSTLDPEDAPRANKSDSVRLLTDSSSEFYIAGFNARRSPLTNPHFRRCLARLFDREQIAEDVFDGYATPANTPLHGTEYVPSDLEWNGESAVGAFPSENGDMDVEAAKQLFLDKGYRYSDDGELLSQGQS
ncbi:ABC transporter substrate-binding protein [Halostella pelagica]|uniref:ABC transporter substrate-binding protein n=1 Tax=Halostella pelagica TaxID=2583824 RepID=UPI0010815AD5|nr:ABC transporter substrate-binding protein [Halostella pelagica]